MARLTEWKGHRLLLEAFERSFPRGGASLHFIGGAPFGGDEFRKELEREIANRRLQERVHLIGHVDNVEAWINAMDICVQCSIVPEPLGQNVLQYLSAGAVIVAAEEGGPREWIRNGENGILVAPRDFRALSDALTSLATNPALRRRLALAASGTRVPTTEELVVELQGYLEQFGRSPVTKGRGL
ncbi:glycosyltransferase involved in cell wall biosynthesis [Curtobacterium sp. 1310]|nr:glycosyltransferase involved in cell wall biosynthesis [Curtobacterium sp. 1310]